MTCVAFAYLQDLRLAGQRSIGSGKMPRRVPGPPPSPSLPAVRRAIMARLFADLVAPSGAPTASTGSGHHLTSDCPGSDNGRFPSACARMPAAASGAGTTASLPLTGDAHMAPHLSRDGVAFDTARRLAENSAADAVPSTARARLEAVSGNPSSTTARRRSMADAVGMLDDIRRRIERDPEGARAAALRIVTLLTLPTGGEPVPVRGGLAPWQERKVDRHIQQGLERTLRVKDLAEQASLSVSHFAAPSRRASGRARTCTSPA